MNDNDTISLLRECNAGCKSATNSMEQISSYVKDENLRALLDDYNRRHVELGDKCHTLLDEAGHEEKDPRPLASAMSRMGIGIQLTLGDSTARIAGMLEDGCNMGVKSLAKYKNKYAAASPEAKHITQNLIDLELDMARDLLAYL